MDANKQYSWGSLAKRIEEAYAESCRVGECDCITTDEHDRRLKGVK